MATANSTHDRAGLKSPWDRFFYAEEVPYGLALIRIVLPLVLLAVVVPRWFHARELYSADGATAQIGELYGFPDFLPEFSGTVVVALCTMLIFFLISSSLGWFTRFSLFAATGLYVYLNLLDAIGSLTKYTAIAAHVMLILSLSNCGSLWSVDSWLKRRGQRNHWPGEAKLQWPKSPIWPARLVQMFIGTVYLGASLTKLHTPAFFNSDQLRYWMITNYNYSHPLGEYLAFYPVLLVAFAYITILWEILFIFLVFSRWGRPLMLFIGTSFHLMTTLTLGLYIFPMICMSTYLAFLNENDVRAFAARLRKIKRKLGWTGQQLQGLRARLGSLSVPSSLRPPSAAVFGLLLMTLVAAGVEAEHRLDPYGLRRPEGRHTLQVLDPEYAEQLLSATEPLRQVDKFFSFEVGTTLVGDLVVNRRREFRQGELLIAQVQLNPPHEDMWVECSLRDTNNRVLDRIGQIVPRENSRTSFAYRVAESVEPGEYFLVFKNAGEEVARRRILIKPSAARSAVAN